MLNYNIVTPKSEEDYNDYYYFRWKYLRKPLNKKLGSERDNIENKGIHKMIKNKQGFIIAVGRIHWVSSICAQIRYFAVDKDYRKDGIGTYLMEYFEEISFSEKKEHIILNARENSLPFYEKLGYNIIEKTNLLYGKIQHYKMKKMIQSNKVF